MGGGFLSLFSTLINGEDKVVTRNYISYGYLVMGIMQYMIILIFSSSNTDFTKLYYVLFAFIFFFPSQKIFSKINNQLFIKAINYVALVFGIVALIINLK